MLNCKSFFVMGNTVYACKKHGSHSHMHSNEPSHKPTAISWGNKAPGVVHAPPGSRYVATRGTNPNSSGFAYMGIRDMVTEDYAVGPYEYENEEAFSDLRLEAAEMQKDWEGKLQLLEAEAINTDKFFVEIQLAKEVIKLRPSQYTILFEQDIVESNFDVANRSMISYKMPDVPVYDGKTATELHGAFVVRVAHLLDDINFEATEELLEA